ncbi:MAG: hypothetical protein FWG38_01740 [Defluviitaleaceae bacterium]|nr:hypothetical protein [Defluviitaleaceae bacterium]
MPDIMILEGQPFYAMAESGFLADFYQIIDNHPTLSRDDFFGQVLEAFEFNDGLYAMPLNFGFEYIGINAGLPESAVNRFAQHSGISLSQMLELYLDIINNYPQYSHLQFGPYFELGRIIQFEMSTHINMVHRTSSLANGEFALFLEMLAEARRLHPSNFTLRLEDDGMPLFMLHHPIHLEALAGQYVFANHRHHLDILVALLDYEAPIFTHYVPLTDGMGRLKIDHGPWSRRATEGYMTVNQLQYSSTFATVIVSSNADLDLAWRMVERLIAFVAIEPDLYSGVPSGSIGRRCLSTPIMPTFFDAHYANYMSALFRLFTSNFTDRTPAFFADINLQPTVGGRLVYNRDELTPAGYAQIEHMKARILGYTQMPMTIPLFYLPPAVYEAPIEQFMLGLITAQAAAQEIHNRVSLWLIE